MPINYKVIDKDKFTLVEFEIEGGIITTDELKEAINSFPNVDNTKGVCVSGRGPVWLFSALTEKNHPARFFSTFEPRENACIVTSSHTKDYDIGDKLSL